MLRVILATALVLSSYPGNGQVAPQPQQSAPSEQTKVTTLEEAYEKELIFLRREIALLQNRKVEQNKALAADLKKLNTSIDQLQKEQIELSSSLSDKQASLKKAEQSSSSFAEQKDGLLLTLSRSAESLVKAGYPAVTSDSQTLLERLQTQFDQTFSALKERSRVRRTQGTYFGRGGSEVTGPITKVGAFAAFGEVPGHQGALAPAGEQQLKLWIGSDGEAIAKPTAGSPEQQLFVYSNLNTDMSAAEPKTLRKTLAAGGSIGWVITILGLIALLAILARWLILQRSQRNHERVDQRLTTALSEQPEAAARDIGAMGGGSANLASLALKNRNCEKFEDIIAEGYIEATSKLDRFSTFILVVSAVAPLLGLLGTVTGMIATFDIITEVGTGDPKLLSGGISEALVTTMFGLIVAIPALLLGNMLSSWAERIKADMEKLVLRISNFDSQVGG